MSHRLPYGFQPTERVLEPLQGGLTAFPADLDIARGDARDDHAILASAGGLGEVMHERHVAVEAPRGQARDTVNVARVGNEFVDQDDARTDRLATLRARVTAPRHPL